MIPQNVFGSAKTAFVRPFKRSFLYQVASLLFRKYRPLNQVFNTELNHSETHAEERGFNYLNAPNFGNVDEEQSARLQMPSFSNILVGLKEIPSVPKWVYRR
jgi:hypothetical protein